MALVVSACARRLRQLQGFRPLQGKLDPRSRPPPGRLSSVRKRPSCAAASATTPSGSSERRSATARSSRSIALGRAALPEVDLGEDRSDPGRRSDEPFGLEDGERLVQERNGFFRAPAPPRHPPGLLVKLGAHERLVRQLGRLLEVPLRLARRGERRGRSPARASISRAFALISPASSASGASR